MPHQIDSERASGDLRDTAQVADEKVCFVIMPIADQEGYAAGHFKEVFEDLICPAIQDAGYRAVRADQVHASNLIHLDIIGQLLDAPMAVCDLSSVNPNVMFELGIRQAFDKPVVLLKDRKTREIFDIAPIRYVSYDASLSYRGINSARSALTEAIMATAAMKTGDGKNSIVSLLGLRAAAIAPSDQDPQAAQFSLLEKAISELAADVRSLKNAGKILRNTESAVDDVLAADTHSRNISVTSPTGKRYRMPKSYYDSMLIEASKIYKMDKDTAYQVLKELDESKQDIIAGILLKEFKTVVRSP